MRILKKLLVRIILLIVAAGILCGSVVAVLGYLMYRDALKEQSLEDRVAEVKAKYEAGRYDVSANKLAAKLMERYNTITF